MRTYFSISHNDNRKTPYASTILNNNGGYLEDCPLCGRTRFNEANKDLVLLIEGKGKLPDYLQCGHYPLTIVSDRVLQTWKDVSVSGYESFPIKIIDNENKKRNHEQYHNIIITGRAELDFEKMGVKIVSICQECGEVEYNKQDWEFGKAIIKDNTYDGSDLFTFKYFCAAPLCTLKILEAVYNNKLTNFQFMFLESFFIYLDTSPIDLKELLRIGK